MRRASENHKFLEATRICDVMQVTLRIVDNIASDGPDRLALMVAMGKVSDVVMTTQARLLLSCLGRTLFQDCEVIQLHSSSRKTFWQGGNTFPLP